MGVNRMNDLISRKAAIDACLDGWNKGYEEILADIRGFPSAQPTLYGYDIEMLKAIADTLTAKGLTPEAYADLITDTGRVVQMVLDEQREALRKAIDELENNRFPGAPYVDAGISIAINKIKEVPSAQQERWIPVGERLPDDNVPVNITWVNHDPAPYYSDIKDIPFSATAVYYQGKWYWYSSTIEDYLIRLEYDHAERDEIEEAMHNSIEVIAWIPLPEPYAERRTDE